MDRVSNAKWKSAARRYRDSKPDALKRAREARIREAAQELISFMGSSDGETAKELLRASGKSIPIGTVSGGDLRTLSYEMWCDGLQVRIESPGRLETRAPDHCEVIEAALTSNPDQFNDPMRDVPSIVPWICSQLDAIAEAALKGE